MSSHRILYVGHDLTLLDFLRDMLRDYRIVRCPSGRLARPLIESEINYALLLFDDKLTDMTGVELEQFARSQKHRKQTPVVIFKKSGDFGSMVETIIRLLDRGAG
jgi:DNA-binding response OmpR family regulator